MFSNALKVLLFGIVFAGAQELPLSTIDVFVQSGEISASSANVMARCNDETSTSVGIVFECSDESCPEPQDATVDADTDFTHTFQIKDLDSFSLYKYTVSCSNSGTPGTGSFKTAPANDQEVPIKFVWAADLAGQGYGRNPDFEVTMVDGTTVKGGYVVFDTMEGLEPDFALFQGDMIYADDSIPPSKAYTNGTETLGVWTNNPSKPFVAVTLDEFRYNWKYNFGDDKMQSFLSKIPVFVQWDDHEVTNNWWPGEIMTGSSLYEEGLEVDTLYENSLKAFYEYNPILDGQSIYRSQKFGKHLEIFFPDYRSFRDPNPDNTNEDIAGMMGPEQTEWLKNSLKASTATWKVISSHDPFGIVTGSEGDFDSYGNSDPKILGRELEFKELLSFIEKEGITGIVSLTSDVHFTAHVNLHPDRAEGNFTNFRPMDEFVIGPIHAGSFGPNYMDTSFGAEYQYEMGPLTMGYERWASLAPEVHELQSFGYAEVSEDGSELSVQLVNIDGSIMFSKTLKAGETVQGDKDCQTISEYVCSNDDFTILCDLFTEMADPSLRVEDMESFTLFAPTNAAFDGQMLDFLKAIPEAGTIVSYHATSPGSIVRAKDLKCTGLVEMALGGMSRTKCIKNPDTDLWEFYQKGGGNRKNNIIPKIVESDIEACNGVIHVVDNVMLPNFVDNVF